MHTQSADHHELCAHIVEITAKWVIANYISMGAWWIPKKAKSSHDHRCEVLIFARRCRLTDLNEQMLRYNGYSSLVISYSVVSLRN